MLYCIGAQLFKSANIPLATSQLSIRDKQKGEGDKKIKKEILCKNKSVTHPRQDGPGRAEAAAAQADLGRGTSLIN